MLRMVMEMRTEQAILAVLRLLQLVELLDLGNERAKVSGQVSGKVSKKSERKVRNECVAEK